MDINECSEEYRRYLHSEKWAKIRENVLFRDEFACRICGSKTHLQVHHINGRGRFCEDKHMDTVMCLCESCHTKIHLYFKVCDSIKEYYDNKRTQERRAKGLP